MLTQIGFSGSDRYLIAPVALLVVAGAVGWGALLAPARALIAARLTRAWLRPALAGATALAAVAVLLALTVPWRGSHLAGVADTASEVRYQATLWQDLREAVSDAGGVRRADLRAARSRPTRLRRRSPLGRSVSRCCGPRMATATC